MLGLTSQEFRSKIIASLASRWRYLADIHPDEEAFKGLEQWYKEGSQLALVASGRRHYTHAWNAHGGGYASSVTSKGWQGFEKHSKIAVDDMDRAIKMGDPPLLALQIRIQAGLEQGEELEDVDPLCRLACQAYPGELEPHRGVLLKLLPQWYGEPGDVLSFALSTSKMFAGSEGDLLYTRLVSQACRWVDFQDRSAWVSYDRNRMRRGVEECIRRGMCNDDELWRILRHFFMRTGDTEAARILLVDLMSRRVAPPWLYTNADYRDVAPQMHEMSDELWAQ